MSIYDFVQCLCTFLIKELYRYLSEFFQHCHEMERVIQFLFWCNFWQTCSSSVKKYLWEYPKVNGKVIYWNHLISGCTANIQVHVWVALYAKMDVFNNLLLVYWFYFCVYFNRTIFLWMFKKIYVASSKIHVALKEVSVTVWFQNYSVSWTAGRN